MVTLSINLEGLLLIHVLNFWNNSKKSVHVHVWERWGGGMFLLASEV